MDTPRISPGTTECPDDTTDFTDTHLNCGGEKRPRRVRSTDFFYKKPSPEIDVRKSNVVDVDVTFMSNKVNTDDTLNASGNNLLSTMSTKNQASRRIYSPVPRHVNATDASWLGTPHTQEADSEIGGWDNNSYRRGNKSFSKRDTPFPAIKVECFDGESSANEKTPIYHNDIKKCGRSNSFTGLAEMTDRTDLNQNKSLLVPSTLIRRRSTDGRLMVGVSDFLVGSNLANASTKAWSRSEGNIVGAMNPSRNEPSTNRFPDIVTRDDRFRSTRNSQDVTVQEEGSIFGKHKTVLEPIKQNNNYSKYNNNKNETNDFRAAGHNLDSSDVVSSFDKFKISSTEQSDGGLNFSKRYSSASGCKPRAKSFSPRRSNQLEPLCPAETPFDSESELFQDKDIRKAVRFLSPQPRRRLSPLYRENLDWQ